MPEEVQQLISLVEAGGKYEIIKQNQEGANAYAFKAKHVPLAKDVFLKICGRPEGDSGVFEEPRLLVEATTGGETNDHIIQVLDAERLDDEWALFCMEWIEKGSLLSIIKNDPPSLCCAIEITKGILRGLAAFHRKLFVHRDLKPANILLDENGGCFVPKLGDFGSVVKLKNLGDVVTASRHSALYVPPEGWAAESQYTSQSDIYQVGIVMAELLCGPLPYSPESWLDREAKGEIKGHGCNKLCDVPPWESCHIVDNAIARKAMSGKITTKLNWGSHIDRNLKAIVSKASNPDPSKRFSAAADMLTALDAIACPDWNCNHEDSVLSAFDWQGWDWRILERPRGGFEVKRSRAGNNSWRRWGETHMKVNSAIRLVANFS